MVSFPKRREDFVSKRIFYLCGAILCLAVAYHLGAVQAVAQSPVRVEAVSIQNVSGGGLRASGVVNRKFYYVQDGIVHPYAEPIPGKDRIVASDPGFITVVLENGDWLQWNGGQWVKIGNLVGSP
jgi:hypothetical protein